MAKGIERQRLNLDLEALFPGDTLMIGGQSIEIRPLGIKELSKIARKLKTFSAQLIDDGVTWDNYSEPENLLKLAIVLLEKFPEVLEEATNVAIEDLENLPIEFVVLVLDKVLEVNMKSKDTLEGNFKSLTQRLNLTQTKEKPASTKSRSPKRSKS